VRTNDSNYAADVLAFVTVGTVRGRAYNNCDAVDYEYGQRQKRNHSLFVLFPSLEHTPITLSMQVLYQLLNSMIQTYASYSDVRLYTLLQGGAREKEVAFSELYRRHSSRIFLYCRYILGETDNTRDVFQETWLRLLQSAEQRREVQNVPAYLLRISRNLCLDVQQASGRRVFLPLDELQLPAEEPAVRVGELETLIETALETLTEEYREAFVLQTYNGLSYKEIAEIIEEPVSTVRNRVVRAKSKLRAVLAPFLLEANASR